MSRPPILDDTKKEVVCALVAVGASRRRAAEVIGVDEAAIRYALKTDPAFAQRVVQAETLLEIEFMVKLRQNAGRSWRASVWALQSLERQRENNTKRDPVADSVEEADTEYKIKKWDTQARAAAKEDAARAAKGQPPRPAPTPDPNDTTLLVAREFKTALDSLLTKCDAQVQDQQDQSRERVQSEAIKAKALAARVAHLQREARLDRRPLNESSNMHFPLRNADAGNNLEFFRRPYDESKPYEPWPPKRAAAEPIGEPAGAAPPPAHDSTGSSTGDTRVDEAQSSNSAAGPVADRSDNDASAGED